jgi:hypothetical protein
MAHRSIAPTTAPRAPSLAARGAQHATGTFAIPKRVVALRRLAAGGLDENTLARLRQAEEETARLRAELSSLQVFIAFLCCVACRRTYLSLRCAGECVGSELHRIDSSGSGWFRAAKMQCAPRQSKKQKLRSKLLVEWPTSHSVLGSAPPSTCGRRR